MRLVDFLIYLLEAHASTLQRLAAMFGEEMLLHMLEESGDSIAERMPAPVFDASSLLLPVTGEFSSPYAELEGAVREFHLPAILEFHLWAYPTYRHLIEGEWALDARFRGPDDPAGAALVDEVVAQAEAWVKMLPIASDFAPRAQSAAHVPWLRFRTQVLKKVGKRPLGPVPTGT